MNNKKGQMIILRIMIAVIVLIMVVIMAQPTKEAIDSNTNITEMNCSSNSLSDAQEATCIVTDFLLFYMIGIAISAGMAFLAGKKSISGVITGIVVFVVTTILINPLKDFIVYIRDASHLNCASGTISVGSRLSCILLDVWLFWFVATALAAALTYFFIKVTYKE